VRTMVMAGVDPSLLLPLSRVTSFMCASWQPRPCV
jgi:hypothetical protein